MLQYYRIVIQSELNFVVDSVSKKYSMLRVNVFNILK